jgi:hypothetical protein
MFDTKGGSRSLNIEGHTIQWTKEKGKQDKNDRQNNAALYI